MPDGAMRQSNQIIRRLLQWFFSIMHWAILHIINLLWFVEVSEQELDNLLSVGSNVMPSNAISPTFDFKVVLQEAGIAKSFVEVW